MTEKNKIRYLHIFVIKKKKEARCGEVSPPFTTSENQSRDLHRPERNHARTRITTYNNDVSGRPVICADIPRTPSLKVAQSRLDLSNDAEDENDGDDDVIPAV